MLTEEGELQKSTDVFFKDNDVTNAEIIKDDLLICTINDQDGISQLMTVNVDEDKTELIIDQKENKCAFDLTKIPGTGEDAYFIMHTGTGLFLIDPLNHKSYTLHYEEDENFNICRSVATELIDDNEPERGFWLANIDNSNPFYPEIKVFDFNNKFITELRKISEQVGAGKEK